MPDEFVRRAEAKQQREREEVAHKRGQARRKEDQAKPDNDGSPTKDGYGSMTSGEREAYKRGVRGE